MESFGNFIRQLRKEKDWTLTQLAAMLDIDSANLSKIETNKRSFDEKKLPVLCGIFGLDLHKMKKELISEKFAHIVVSQNIDEEVFKLAERKVVKLITRK